MEKLMTLETLSSIKGASSSDDIEEMFNTIKQLDVKSQSMQQSILNSKSICIEDLRSDEPIACNTKEVELIIQGFPKEKNRYLVVQKVID